MSSSRPEYPSLIAAYLEHTYADRGLEVHPRVELASSSGGAPRMVDLLVVERSTGKALAILCRRPGSTAVADLELSRALEMISSLRVPGCIVHAGASASPAVAERLAGSKRLAHCMPNPWTLRPEAASLGHSLTFDTSALDRLLATTFGWTDLIELTAEDAAALEGDPRTLWPELVTELEAARLASGETRRPRAKRPQSIAVATPLQRWS